MLEAPEMARLKGKVPLLLAAAIILSMTWLGYWIGQMSNSSHISHLQEKLAKFESQQPPSTRHHSEAQKYVHDTEDRGFHRSGIRPKPDNVYVIGRHGKLNVETNSIDDGSKTSDQTLAIHHQNPAEKSNQYTNNDKLTGKTRERVFQVAKSKQTDFGVPGVKPMEVGNDPPSVSQKSDRELGGGRTRAIIRPETPKNLTSAKRQTFNPQPIGEIKYPDHGISFTSKLPSREAVQAEIEFQQLRKRLREEVKPKPTPTDPALNDLLIHTFDPTGQYYALLHGGEATKVHGQIHQKLQAMDKSVPTEAYIFKAKNLPRSQRLRPSIANGHLGTAIHSSKVFMNGVYCGQAGETHRAEIPSTVSFNITSTEPASNFTRTYVLNSGEGVYSEETVSEGYTLTQRIYAHRKYSRLLVVEVDLLRKEVRTPLKLNVKLNRWRASPDITFVGMNNMPGMEEVSYKVGTINAPETTTSGHTEVHIFYDHVPRTLTPIAGALRTKWVFLTSIAKTKDEALEAYHLGSRLLKSNDQLYAEHIKSWASVWAAGRIDVVGNLQLAQYIYGAYYYILSSMPLSEDNTSPFIGLSPSGLPFGEFKKDYEGHVFWDQETWMYPAILPLWPSLGRVLLNTRRRTMDAAAANAKTHNNQGLRYPWESALTGMEVTPGAIYGEKEIHISGDISIAIIQYLRATGDTSILQPNQRFLEILTGIANFWVSVLKWNQTMNRYEIKDVIPPDEYHKGVNNSVYTNAVAKLALMAPEMAFSRLNKKMDRWRNQADEIYIPYSLTQKYHPEYDGYIKGTKIKQADAVLLGYPLMLNMDETVRRNDLRNYEDVIDVAGPAMTWAMYTIGWLEVGDLVRADRMFKRSFTYIKNEFLVWQETVLGGGATNFITGMGGFLQSVIYGYGGFRFRDDRLDLNPNLPLDCTQLHFTGVNYLGSILNIFINDDSVLVNVVEKSAKAPDLVLFIYKTEAVHTLELNHAVRVPRMKATITPSPVKQNS